MTLWFFACCNFDKVRLLHALRKISMLGEFKSVIDGFVDTLTLLRQRNFSLEQLAKDAFINTAAAHNAVTDVKIFQQVLEFHRIDDADLLKNKKTV